MTVRTYGSPEAFKQALEQRLRAATKGGPELTRKRQLLVFDRFLARVVAVLGDAAVLKADSFSSSDSIGHERPKT